MLVKVRLAKLAPVVPNETSATVKILPEVVVEVMEVVPKPVKAILPEVPVKFSAPVDKVKPLEAVKVPVEVKPEVAVISPEIVGVAVQAVPVTVKLPPKEVKLEPETVKVLSRVVAPCKVKAPGVVDDPIVLMEEAPDPRVLVLPVPVPRVVAPVEVRVVNDPPAPVTEPTATKLPSVLIVAAALR